MMKIITIYLNVSLMSKYFTKYPNNNKFTVIE